MSDYHVMQGDLGGNEWTLVMHFPVPNVNNDVGVNFRTALMNSNLGRRQFDDGTFGRRTVLPSGTGAGQIITAEETSLDAGELFEIVKQFHIARGATPSEIEAKADGFYTQELGTFNDRMVEVFRYFGHTRDVP